MIVCSRNPIRESSHISFFCGGDPFCEVVWWSENTCKELTGLLEWPAGLSPLTWATSRPLPFAWAISRSLPLVQNYRPYILFKSHADIWISSSPTYFFCLWLVIRAYILPFLFFFVICWSYLRTEISVTLSIGNKLYSRHHLLYLSFLWNHFVDIILRPHWIC